MKDEAGGGIILIAATALALVIANSSLAASYENIVSHSFGFEVHRKIFTFRDWINEGLMSLFFLSVGMEIKREIVNGLLSERQKAVLPVIAALGGMIFPAAIYFFFNPAGPASSGWGIPVATDIAFSLGILSLLGKRIPAGIRVFVASLAIADDLGAVLIIAVFYAKDIEVLWLLCSAGIVAAIVILHKLQKASFASIVILGGILWLCLLLSGVHPTIGGALLGFLLPASDHTRFRSVLGNVVSLAVMPLFAFANAGLAITAAQFSGLFSNPIPLGILFGLLVGKTAGIFSFSFLSSKLGLSSLPEGIRWVHIFGAAILCGIGFTMSLFIARLAFASEDPFYQSAKLAILAASVSAGALGYLFLRKCISPVATKD